MAGHKDSVYGSLLVLWNDSGRSSVSTPAADLESGIEIVSSEIQIQQRAIFERSMTDTTSIPPTSPPEKFSASDSIVCRSGIVGLLVRGMIVTAVIAIATAAMMAARNWELAFGNLSVRVLISIAAVIWFAMMLGVVFSEYPRGDHAAMSRVGLATLRHDLHEGTR